MGRTWTVPPSARTTSHAQWGGGTPSKSLGTSQGYHIDARGEAPRVRGLGALGDGVRGAQTVTALRGSATGPAGSGAAKALVRGVTMAWKKPAMDSATRRMTPR